MGVCFHQISANQGVLVFLWKCNVDALSYQIVSYCHWQCKSSCYVPFFYRKYQQTLDISRGMCPMIMPFFRIATAKYCRSHIEAVALLRCRETTWLCRHGDYELCSQSWKMLPLLVTSWGKSVQLDWDLGGGHIVETNWICKQTPISTLASK